jgi:DNA-binding GntR family transcriptional regulator
VPDRTLSDALHRIPARATTAPAAAERVANALREQIVDGALRSGTRLTEETISAALGFSRNTIREAFVLLVAERLAVREPNRGVFVATPTADDIRDLYATRRLIEPAALEHGPGLSDETLGRLREIVAGAREARERADTEGLAQGNQAFHRAVVALAGSERLDALMAGVLAEMRLVFHLMDEEAGFHEPYLDRNQAIIGDLEAGDRAGAAAALRAYLTDAEEHLLSVLQDRSAAGGRS